MLRSSLIVGGINAAAHAAALGLFVAIATKFGADSHTDAFFLALVIPVAISAPVMNAVISVLVPQLTTAHLREPAQFARIAGGALVWVGGVGLIGSACIAAASPFIAPVLGDHLGDAARTEFTYHALVLAPMVFIQCVAAVLTACYNAVQQYARPALSFAARHISAVACVMVFSGILDVAVLSAAFVIGTGVQLALLLVGLRQLPYAFRPAWHGAAEMRRVLIAGGGLLLSSVLLQSVAVVGRFLAVQMDTGSVTIFDYAVRMTGILVELVGSGILLVTMVNWSGLVARQQLRELRSSLLTTVRWVLIVTVPIIALLAVVRQPAVEVVIGRGAAATEVARAVADVFGILLLSVPLELVARLGLRMYVAWQLPWAMAGFATLRLCAFVAIASVLVSTYGIAGLALAEVASVALLSAAVFAGLRRRLASTGAAPALPADPVKVR